MAAIPPSVLAEYSPKPIFRNKPYAHLDAKRQPEPMQSFIKDPEWVARHGFLPFIHVVLKTRRRKGKHVRPEYKDRHIYYASHLDRYVYQWYAHLTSEAYESYIKANAFDAAPIAYRSIDSKTNIHFAKEAFDFIRKQEDSFVFISDFHKFFDNLDHALLKEKLKTVFGVRELPDDHYRVYKNMTKFRYFDLQDIAKALGTTKELLRHRTRKPDRLLSSAAMRSMKKEFLKSNDNRRSEVIVGIPQGSPISAVYANVYMIDFDKELQNFTLSLNGFYRRYSDDIICAVPFHERARFEAFFAELLTSIRADISPAKTKRFRVVEGKPFTDPSIFVGVDTYNRPGIIDYLGFSYNGACVRLREGTLNKYYQKLTRRLFLLQHISTQKGRIVGRKHLYARSSHLGEANRRNLQELRASDAPISIKKRNFFTYERNAAEIFGDDQIRHQVGGHWRRIHKFIRDINIEVRK
ncbi:MAG TPA: reverse transcriptase domain-containing protein [Rectinemataceae bacterium]|nr:reverse transcriptase domain-containing protein [Rectinemataceae bacterium]